MKNPARPNLSHVERGAAVVVWLPDDERLVKATVQAFKHGEVRVRWHDPGYHGPHSYRRAGRRTFTIKRRDEGVTWCFDRDDETARAFQAACVMA
jgi:hypothetical protein